MRLAGALHPHPLVDAGGGDQIKFGIVGGASVHEGVDQCFQAFALVGGAGLERRVEIDRRANRQLVDPIGFIGPLDRPAREIELPRADLGDALGLQQTLFADRQIAALRFEFADQLLRVLRRAAPAQHPGDGPGEMARHAPLRRRHLARVEPQRQQRAERRPGADRERRPEQKSHMRVADDEWMLCESRVPPQVLDGFDFGRVAHEMAERQAEVGVLRRRTDGL